MPINPFQIMSDTEKCLFRKTYKSMADICRKEAQ